MKAAINELMIALETMETNEPINRTAGNVEQADLEAANASDFRHALAVLKAARPGSDFKATRLRRVATLLGVSVPESDETLIVAAGSVLGEIERAIEQSFKAQKCGQECDHLCQMPDGFGGCAKGKCVVPNA